MKRILAFLWVLVIGACPVEYGAVLHGATGCAFPPTLDSYADKASGDSLTNLELNSRTCAISAIEAELGTLPKGSFGSVKLRFEDLDLIRTGKAGGQTITGGTAESEILTLKSTSHGTRGPVRIEDIPALDAVSPAQITADQNDYAPGAKGVLRFTTDALRNITGMSGGVNSRLQYLVNVGSFPGVLKNESASSTAANRFLTATGADITLNPNDTALALYDTTTARWRVHLFAPQREILAAKSADEIVNDSAALQDDDDLKCPVQASKRYLVEAVIAASAANTTADFKLGWTLPASGTMVWGPLTVTTGAGAVSAAYWSPFGVGVTPDALLAQSASLSFGSGALTSGIKLTGLASIAGTAGTLQLQWSQDTANVSDSKFLAGSVLRCTLLN